jgi:hypothetical protein
MSKHEVRMSLTNLEAREVPAALFTATGIEVGGGPRVSVFDSANVKKGDFFASNPALANGIRVATGEVFLGNNEEDIVTATGPNETGVIRVYDGLNFTGPGVNGNPGFNAQTLSQIDPSVVWSTGGIRITIGQVQPGGKEEIVATANAIINGQFRQRTLVLTGNFQLLAAFTAPANLAASNAANIGVPTVGDLNGDGWGEVIIGSSQANAFAADVFAFDGNLLFNNPAALSAITIYDAPSNATGPVFVAAGNTGLNQNNVFNGDGRAELFISFTVPNQATTILRRDGTSGYNVQGSSIFTGIANPFSGFGGQIRLAMDDVDNDGLADLIMGAGPGGGPRVTIYKSGNSGIQLGNYFSIEPTFTGGIYVG